MTDGGAGLSLEDQLRSHVLIRTDGGLNLYGRCTEYVVV